MTETRKATRKDISQFLASFPVKLSLHDFLESCEITIDMLPFLQFTIEDFFESLPKQDQTLEHLQEIVKKAVQSLHFAKTIIASREAKKEATDSQLLDILHHHYQEGCETIKKSLILDEKKSHYVNNTAMRTTNDHLIFLWRLKIDQIATISSIPLMFVAFREAHCELNRVLGLIYGIFMIRFNYSVEKKSAYPTKGRMLNEIENKLVNTVKHYDVISDKNRLYSELYLDLLKLRDQNYKLFFSGNKLYKQVDKVIKKFEQWQETALTRDQKILSR